MNDPEITTLARGYAEEECNKSTLPDKTQLHEDKLVEFYDVYSFLLRRFCIVEREKLEAIRFRKVYSADDVRSKFTEECLIDALFPEIAKEVE